MYPMCGELEGQVALWVGEEQEGGGRRGRRGRRERAGTTGFKRDGGSRETGKKERRGGGFFGEILQKLDSWVISNVMILTFCPRSNCGYVSISLKCSRK